MAKIVHIPVKIFDDGTEWLLLKECLGRKAIFRAHKIKKRNNQVKDYDAHKTDEAEAEGSIKCRSKSYSISDKILEL